MFTRITGIPAQHSTPAVSAPAPPPPESRHPYTQISSSWVRHPGPTFQLPDRTL